MYDFYDNCRDTSIWDCKIANIEPVDVRIYYEDKKPYLDYTGEAIAEDGRKLKIHFPKISLSWKEFAYRQTTDRWHGLITSLNMEAKCTTDSDVLFAITECEMTKDEINKIIGCKVKIKE